MQHFLHDLPLYGHVERGGGLVRQEDGRIHQHGDRNARALIHAAGELEGIAVPDPLTVLKVQLFKELQRGALCLGHIHLAVCRHALDDLLADRAGRAQGCAAVLKDHADLLAADPAHLLGRHVRKAFPFKPDVASCDHAAAAQKPHRGLEQRGFSGAGFTHQTEDLAGMELKAHVMDDGLPVEGDLHMLIVQ